jgi:hypothetical protein
MAASGTGWRAMLMSSGARTGQTSPLISGVRRAMPRLEATSMTSLMWLCAGPGGQRPTRQGSARGTASSAATQTVSLSDRKVSQA